MIKANPQNTIPIILAAGRGKRMGTFKNKCLLSICGKTILEWSLETLKKLGFKNVIIVTRSTDRQIKKLFEDRRDIHITITPNPFFLGAGHALFVGTTAIQNPSKYHFILALYGDDSFLYQTQTLTKFLSSFPGKKVPMQLMIVEKKFIGKIGGLKRDRKGHPNGFYTQAELEEMNAKTTEIVCGAFLFKFNWLERHFHKITKSEDSGEFILTSLIRTAHDEGTPASVYKLTDQNEWCGVNTPEELKKARQLKKLQL